MMRDTTVSVRSMMAVIKQLKMKPKHGRYRITEAMVRAAEALDIAAGVDVTTVARINFTTDNAASRTMN
jgi:hypothetical protein